jgi:hypothetical protein
MVRYMEDDDEWGDDGDGSDEDEEHGGEPANDDESTVPCPYCGRAMYEDSLRCPHCGQYISDEDAAPPSKPWWVLVGVVLGLLVVWFWMM